MRYRFHVHRTASAWRLVLPEEGDFPEAAKADDWRQTIAREAADTNADVRAEADARGYCLFRIGGTFEEVDADVARLEEG